ncbi:MAG: dimethylargininase [Gammaproteobacteria bacterium]|nr:dimethylargininase [Gammaproteobacteria bacterium]
MSTAITRDVSPAIGGCELTFVPRTGIDAQRAAQQHRQYQAVLASLGCDVVAMPAAPELADSVFIEDTAIVLDELAVMCLPGAASRRPEVDGVREVLRRYRETRSIELPGTLDGGDLLRVGKTINAGLSTRSNRNGIEQLRSIVADYGYTVVTVETTRCLHLKSAVTEVAPGVLLINPDWVDATIFGSFEQVEIDPREPHAANALRVDDSVVYPASFPRTMERLEKRGVAIAPVDVSELQKAEGAVTCCSLILA